MATVKAWIIVENTHEPIIPRELFDRVQTILSSKSHPRKHAFDNILEGYVFCGECGHPMTQATKTNKHGARYLLRCTNHFMLYSKLLAVLYIRVNKFFTEKLALALDEC